MDDHSERCYPQYASDIQQNWPAEAVVCFRFHLSNCPNLSPTNPNQFCLPLIYMRKLTPYFYIHLQGRNRWKCWIILLRYTRFQGFIYLLVRIVMVTCIAKQMLKVWAGISLMIGRDWLCSSYLHNQIWVLHRDRSDFYPSLIFAVMFSLLKQFG